MRKPFASLTDYYSILSSEYPSFLNRYITLPCMQRLGGVGLLCGTDWTPLYHNSFFYSRLDHSLGVALIVWNFTHDKKQTLAGLFHDLSTPAFSHVNDFRTGDTIKQESTESTNERMVIDDVELAATLVHDGYYGRDVNNYHRFPVCDNEVPRLSADRLEYMFPSGMALDGSWDMESCRRAYKNITILTNEDGLPELGFAEPEIAADYVDRCCRVGLVLQHNENKLALNMLGEILNKAVALGIITEQDTFLMDEAQLMNLFDESSRSASSADTVRFARFYRTFRTMTFIQHTEEPLPGCYCVSLDVKKRYIDPLVQVPSSYKNGTSVCDGRNAVRASVVSKLAGEKIHEFLSFNDTKYGCVRIAD